MDLNELLGRHQLALMGAHGARTPCARTAHEGRAAFYADRIRTLRQTSGVALY
ncbi:MAG: hypothetical protein WA842_01100 [Croceibacterium sp.]